MPIYECYCSHCHTVFSFFSRTADTCKRPSCPRCQRLDMERRVSRFAISKGRTEPSGGEEGMPDVDDSRMERVMQELAGEAEGLDENNPRQMARMMRKLYEGTGMPLEGKVEEAIRRLESGESPEKLEEEMGDVFEGEGPMPGEGAQGVRRLVRKFQPPKVDETLYDM